MSKSFIRTSKINQLKPSLNLRKTYNTKFQACTFRQSLDAPWNSILIGYALFYFMIFTFDGKSLIPVTE